MTIQFSLVRNRRTYRISVGEVLPPIPIRIFDYCALAYSTGGTWAYGQTVDAAILALVEELEERDGCETI